LSTILNSSNIEHDIEFQEEGLENLRAAVSSAEQQTRQPPDSPRSNQRQIRVGLPMKPEESLEGIIS
jgi:hypothetical protein